MSVFACAIANCVETNPVRREAREKEYKKCIQQLGGVEIPAQMLVLLTIAYERKPEQDFLGSCFMELNLGNHWKGQFFTPYEVCRLMAEMTLDPSLEATIDKNGWASINDCACGAGAILIAAANTLQAHGRNYQTKALFVAQDLDRVAAMMRFIQLSLLGCAGYVVVVDSLSNPIVGDTLLPSEQEGQEFWFTPMYFRAEWSMRKLARKLDLMFSQEMPKNNAENLSA